jgi:hypothetical protein
MHFSQNKLSCFLFLLRWLYICNTSIVWVVGAKDAVYSNNGLLYLWRFYGSHFITVSQTAVHLTSSPTPPITLLLHSTLALKCQGFKHPVGSVDQCFVWGTKCLLQCLGKHRVSWTVITKKVCEIDCPDSNKALTTLYNVLLYTVSVKQQKIKLSLCTLQRLTGRADTQR